MRGETHVRRGHEWMYYRCPGRRDERCSYSSANAPARAVEQVVIDHLASHGTPPVLIDMMRDQLRSMPHVPDRTLRSKRSRLEAVLGRLRDAYIWGDLPEGEYRELRRKVERELANLPLPVESNVLAFDSAATRLLPLAEVLPHAAPEHQRAIVAHVVERVVGSGTNVLRLEVRMEARPFFSGIGSLMAPPDGLEPPTQQRSLLDYYLEVVQDALARLARALLRMGSVS